jgi:hypothetical protein
VQIQTYLIEGLIRYENLMDDWWDVDARGGYIRGQRTGKRIGIGDVVTVRIARIELARRELDLAVTEVKGRKGSHEELTVPTRSAWAVPGSAATKRGNRQPTKKHQPGQVRRTHAGLAPAAGVDRNISDTRPDDGAGRNRRHAAGPGPERRIRSPQRRGACERDPLQLQSSSFGHQRTLPDPDGPAVACPSWFHSRAGHPRRGARAPSGGRLRAYATPPA